MKRLHIIGKSKDNRRLTLAKARDAKFGSFEITIGRKLLRLIEEAQEARRPKRAAPAPKVPPAPEPDLAGVKVLPTEPPAEEEPRKVEAPERATPVEAPPEPAPAARAEPAPEPPLAEHAIEGVDIRIGPAPGTKRAPEAKPEAEEPAAEEKPAAEPQSPQAEPEEPAAPRWLHARETRVEIPERSNLTPAEIQALIRSGRGVRAVARLAGTPLAWIKYLAEPIRQERQGVVDQLLRSRQTRARLGPSSETIGESVYQNLRSKGIRSPDRILEDGFSAHRSDDGEWRVRLSFDHRGKRYSARWRLDPQTREVIPQNTMAIQLGWRRPRGVEEDDGEEPRRRSAPRRAAPRRAPARARTRKRSAPRKKTAAARKRAGRGSSTARRKTSGRSRR